MVTTTNFILSFCFLETTILIVTANRNTSLLQKKRSHAHESSDLDLVKTTIQNNTKCAPNSPCFLQKQLKSDQFEENLDMTVNQRKEAQPQSEVTAPRQTLQARLRTPNFRIPIVNNPDANLNVDVNRIPDRRNTDGHGETSRIPNIYRTPIATWGGDENRNQYADDTTRNPIRIKTRATTKVYDEYSDSYERFTTTYKTFKDKYVPISLIKTAPARNTRKTTRSTTPVFFIPISQDNNYPLPNNDGSYNNFYSNDRNSYYDSMLPPNFNYMNDDNFFNFMSTTNGIHNNPINQFSTPTSTIDISSSPHFLPFGTVTYPAYITTTTMQPSVTIPTWSSSLAPNGNPWWSQAVVNPMFQSTPIVPWWPPPVVNYNPWITETTTINTHNVITSSVQDQDNNLFFRFTTVTVPRYVPTKYKPTQTPVSQDTNRNNINVPLYPYPPMYPFPPVYPYPAPTVYTVTVTFSPLIVTNSKRTTSPRLTNRPLKTSKSNYEDIDSESTSEFFIKFTKITVPPNVITKKQRSQNKHTPSTKSKKNYEAVIKFTTAKTTSKTKKVLKVVHSTIHVKFSEKKSQHKFQIQNQSTTQSVKSTVTPTHLQFTLIKNKTKIVNDY